MELILSSHISYQYCFNCIINFKEGVILKCQDKRYKLEIWVKSSWGKAIWGSFCLKLTWNYDSELEKNTSKVEWVIGNSPLINCQIIYSISMSIMDEYPHFQEQFVCIQW